MKIGERTEKLDAALANFLRDFHKESGIGVAVISNFEEGTIQISIQEVKK